MILRPRFRFPPSHFLPQWTPFSNPCVACPSSSEGSPISWRLDLLFSELWRTPADEKTTRRFSPTHCITVTKEKKWQQTTFLGSLTISSEMQSTVPAAGPLSLKSQWGSSTQLNHCCGAGAVGSSKLQGGRMPACLEGVLVDRFSVVKCLLVAWNTAETSVDTERHVYQHLRWVVRLDIDVNRSRVWLQIGSVCTVAQVQGDVEVVHGFPVYLDRDRQAESFERFNDLFS